MHDPVIVMGMMRSGTTLLAEMLHKGGTRMIADDDTTDPSYDHGIKYERRLTLELNLAILGLEQNQESITLLNCPLQPLPENAWQRLADEVKNEPWGFKNPRTTLTYPIWCRMFPRGPRLYIYRSHEEVVRFYFGTREKWWQQIKRGRQGMHGWIQFNKHMLRNLESDRKAGRPAVLVRYEELMEDPTLITRIEDTLQVCLHDARCEEMRRNRIRSRGEKLLCRLLAYGYEKQIAQLYRNLGSMCLSSHPQAAPSHETASSPLVYGRTIF